MVFTVFVELAGCAVKRQQHVFTGLVTGGANGFNNQLQRFFVAVQVGCETAFIANSSREAFAVAQFFQCVENFGATAQGFAEAFGAHRHNHKFLNVQAVVGVFAAVDHVHHRYRHRHRACTAQIAVEWQAGIFGSSAGNGHRNSQHRVGTQMAFVIGAVEIQHHFINIALFGSINAD